MPRLQRHSSSWEVTAPRGDRCAVVARPGRAREVYLRAPVALVGRVDLVRRSSRSLSVFLSADEDEETGGKDLESDHRLCLVQVETQRRLA